MVTMPANGDVASQSATKAVGYAMRTLLAGNQCDLPELLKPAYVGRLFVAR